MTALVLDEYEANRLIQERRDSGNDRWDEVWEGVYVLMPNPNFEHQDVSTGLATVFRIVIDWTGMGKVYNGVNVSDRLEGWKVNFRCPDVAVYLAGNPATLCEAHSRGGPDFAVEIVSPGNRSREKLAFFGQVGVRELLLVDRDPWRLELHQLREGSLVLSGSSELDRSVTLASSVLPMTFRLVAGADRPAIEATHVDGVQRRLV